MKLLVTGGLGFIGSNFIRQRLRDHPNDVIINLDKITYASNPLSKNLIKNPQYSFVKGDIADYDTVFSVAKDVDCIVNFAAESHVDNSIASSDIFIRSNIVGVHTILKVLRDLDVRLHHVSTDEVFGSLDINSKEKFHDGSPYNPRNPYSATKASSDFLIRAFCNTYDVKATISNCGNNYGPYQHPEKLIPKAILNALSGEKIPIYGGGEQIRDWIYVDDHCSAISLIIDKGRIGETYLVGGNGEKSNRYVVNRILEIMGKPQSFIQYVNDRPGHDVRYSIETSPSLKALGWRKTIDFDTGIRKTIKHYIENYEAYLNYKHWESEWY
jgi:dTDP-glucose 4,6-dehydratase